MDEQNRILYIRTVPSIPQSSAMVVPREQYSHTVNNRQHNKEVRMDTVKIDDVLRLQDFGLERLDEDRSDLAVRPAAPRRESPVGWTSPKERS